MNRQRAVTFVNGQGHQLVGILHEPSATPRRDIAILLLSPGVKNRVAPHRLYNKMAAAYVELGFPVLRFDFHGLGDSEGDVPEPLLADLYRSIQLGRYVDDTRCAMTWMRQTYGIERFILGGLCGGAITGVLAGSDDPAVIGILGLGLPVMLDGSNVDKVAEMTTGQLTSVRSRYIAKLRNPSAWLRLLSGKSDFRLLARALKTSASRGAPSRERHGTRSTELLPTAGNANPSFAPAFLKILGEGRPILLLFSGADRLLAEFREKFLQAHTEHVRRVDKALDLVVVENANHVFTFGEWQQEMLLRTRKWLLSRYEMETASAGAFAAEQHVPGGK
jgi:uncharacterized protein